MGNFHTENTALESTAGLDIECTLQLVLFDREDTLTWPAELQLHVIVVSLNKPQDAIVFQTESLPISVL